MHDPSVYLTSSGVRSRVLERDPSKGYGFAPYIMHMIEQVTGHTFDYDKIHKALKIVADLPEIGVPPASPREVAEVDAPVGGAAVGGASPLPRGSHSRSTSRRGSPPSPNRKFFSSIFGMCRHTS